MPAIKLLDTRQEEAVFWEVNMRLLVLPIIAAILFATPALAYDAALGNRAYPIVGHDIVSGKVKSLEEYRGKWVLLEFWASW
jgi:hypothetical protein